MRYRLLAAIVAAGMLLPGPVAAHERTILDPDDSPGPLDIVVARLKHSKSQFKLRIVTYEQWPDSTVSSDINYVRFDLDRPATGRLDRCLVIHLFPPEGEGPTATSGTIYKNCSAIPPYRSPIGNVDQVTRPDAHSIEVFVKHRSLWRKRPATVRFRALTSYEDKNHPDCQPPDPLPPEHFIGTCSDTTRWKKHARRG